jgi:hypothetical protein
MRAAMHSAVPSYSKATEVASETKVQSDLLAMELHRRLDKKLALADYFTGEPYRFDARTKAWSSAGPDKEHGTDDDIRLGSPK